jgi:multisubunit Na+/H+ antiporter MnhE subunit
MAVLDIVEMPILLLLVWLVFGRSYDVLGVLAPGVFGYTVARFVRNMFG